MEAVPKIVLRDDDVGVRDEGGRGEIFKEVLDLRVSHRICKMHLKGKPESKIFACSKLLLLRSASDFGLKKIFQYGFSSEKRGSIN